MGKFYLKNLTEEGNKQQKIFRILVARGFLIDEIDGKYFLSDNATMSDLDYLKEGFSKYCLGNVIDSGDYDKKTRRNWDNRAAYRSYEYDAIPFQKVELVLSNDATIENAINFFHCMGRNRSEAGSTERSWREFSIEKHGVKVPVGNLESYVAFYVKAVSACGVYTCYCCDGNHQEGGQVYVYSDYPSSIWHSYLWEYIVKKKFGDIPFIEKHIVFNNETKELLYQKLYDIASYLYANRKYIRELKALSVKKLTKNFLNTHSREEIAGVYCEECDRIFTKLELENI